MSLGRIYISGKISGLNPEDVRAKFASAEKRLRALGYETVNPLDNGLDATEPWASHMAMDISLLLSCGSIYMLSDWPQSRGAQVEYYLAHVQGKAIMYEEAPAVEHLAAAVESVFEVSFDILRQKERKQEFVFARTVFAGVASELGFTAPEIGAQLRRDRTTIIHYLHQYEYGIKHSKSFANKVEAVREKVLKSIKKEYNDKHSL